MKARSKRLVAQLRLLLNIKWWTLRQHIDLWRRIGVVAAWMQDYLAQTVIAFVGSALVITFVGVMFADGTAGTFQEWLGTGNKKETLEFLGLGISGVIAFYGLIVFNRRAAAQDENNRLIEKGLSQERFKTAVDHLANKDSETARIASFYEFFYLAKDNKDNYAQTVLDILCAHFRRINSYTNPAEESAEKVNALEVKILIDILFGHQTDIFLGNQTAYVFNELRFDLQGVDLRKAIFQRESNLQGANFMGANLESAKLASVNLEGANFMGANLSAANLEKANLERANFTDANLKGANLKGAHLQNANLENANLHLANLQKAQLWFADLRNANLTAVDLGGANLQNTNLTNANLEGADLRKAHLQNANLENANLHLISLQEARLWDANLNYANLIGAELCDASLENADLQCVDFSGADLKETLFAGANLCGADLSCADNFDYAILFNIIDDEETKYPPGFKKPEE